MKLLGMEQCLVVNHCGQERILLGRIFADRGLSSKSMGDKFLQDVYQLSQKPIICPSLEGLF